MFCSVLFFQSTQVIPTAYSSPRTNLSLPTLDLCAISFLGSFLVWEPSVLEVASVVCLSSIRSQKLSEIDAKFRHLYRQESLANAKVNARQLWHVRRPLSCLTPRISRTPANICITLISLETTFTGLHFRRWVYLHSFSCCSLPKTRNHAKLRENSTLQQFKVIQGHRSWCQSKAHMWLPISH